MKSANSWAQRSRLSRTTCEALLTSWAFGPALNWRCMLPATLIRIGVGKPITPLRPWDDQKPANDAKPPMGPISGQLPLWLAGNQMRSNHFHLRYFCKSFPLDHFFCADQSN